MLRSLFALGVLACALAVVGVASGSKPPASSSTGVGSVFLPNPVADLQIQTLTDQNDSDAAVPAAAATSRCLSRRCAERCWSSPATVSS